jgi:hypothetical protein
MKKLRYLTLIAFVALTSVMSCICHSAKGDNETWVAVTDGFGGWVIKAEFEDLEGIKLF